MGKEREAQRKALDRVKKRLAMDLRKIVADEKKASEDNEEALRARAATRDCGPVDAGCQVCDRLKPCGWRQGLLLDEHRPDVFGVEMRGVLLPELVEQDDGEGGVEQVTRFGPAVLFQVTGTRDVFTSTTVLENGRPAVQVELIEDVAEVVQAFAVAGKVMVADVYGTVMLHLGWPEERLEQVITVGRTDGPDSGPFLN